MGEFASHSAACKAINHSRDNKSVDVYWARPEARTSLLGGKGKLDMGGSTLTLAEVPGTLAESREKAELPEVLVNFFAPQVYNLPEGCWSAADLAVFHLLPQSLWCALWG